MRFKTTCSQDVQQCGRTFSRCWMRVEAHASKSTRPRVPDLTARVHHTCKAISTANRRAKPLMPCRMPACSVNVRTDQCDARCVVTWGVMCFVHVALLLVPFLPPFCCNDVSAGSPQAGRKGGLAAAFCWGRCAGQHCDNQWKPGVFAVAGWNVHQERGFFLGSSSLSLHIASDLPPFPGVAIARASGQHCDNPIESGVVSVQGSGVHQEGVALWISGHFHDWFHEIHLQEVHPMIRGTVSSLSPDTCLGILHYQVAATPPETLQATVPDGAEHEVSIVVVSHNLMDPRSCGHITEPRDDDFRTGLPPVGSCRPGALLQSSAAPNSKHTSAEERRPNGTCSALGGQPMWHRLETRCFHILFPKASTNMTTVMRSVFWIGSEHSLSTA